MSATKNWNLSLTIFPIILTNDEEYSAKVIAKEENDESHADGEQVDVEGQRHKVFGDIAQPQQLEGHPQRGHRLGQRAGAQLGESKLLLRGFPTGNDSVRRDDTDVKPNGAVRCNRVCKIIRTCSIERKPYLEVTQDYEI